MDSDLIELVSTARTLRLAAMSAPHDWPPAARAMCGLCLGLASNAEAVLAIVKAQDALINKLRADVICLKAELDAVRASHAAEHGN